MDVCHPFGASSAFIPWDTWLTCEETEATAGTGELTKDQGTPGAFDGPDNITVSPYGGLLIAEDGEGVQQLVGVTADPRPFRDSVAR